MECIFEAYTEHDDRIAKALSSFGCYLIGGTAIDAYCQQLSIKKARKRSYNDLDFYTPATNKHIKNVEIYLKDNGFDIEVTSPYQIISSNKILGIDVDVLIDFGKENKKMFNQIKGLNVMHPVYLFKSKFQRYLTSRGERRKTDEIDLLQLLSIINKLNEVDTLEQELSKMNFVYSDEIQLNELISKFNLQYT